MVTNQCKAESTSGKDGFGLDQVAKILGDLMGKLMKGGKESGQQGNATPQTPAQPPTCNLSSGVVSSNASSTTARLTWTTYFYSSSGSASDPTGTVSISPTVGQVEQSGSRDVTVSTATTYTMTVSGAGGTGSCSTTVIGLGDGGGDGCGILGCPGDPDPEDPEDPETPDALTGELNATPVSGEAPLSVAVAFEVSQEGSYSITFGDISQRFSITLEEGRCTDGTNFGACGLDGQVRHIYEDAGTYQIKLTPNCPGDATCNINVLDTISVTVREEGAVPVRELIATPSSGTAPLSVDFTGNAGTAGYTIEFGDGRSVSAGCANGGCGAGPSLDVDQEHTYTAAGTYTAKLRSHARSNAAACAGVDCNVVDTASIVVRNPTATTTTPTATTTTPTTPTTPTATTTHPVPVFTNPAFLLPGIRGDIVTIQSGGTVLAGFRDQAKNTEISGFYGSYTFNAQPQGVVSRLCQSRPWSGGFLSFIVPATFFDGLCTSRGYQVGTFTQQPTTGTGNVPTVVVTQTKPKNTNSNTTKVTPTTPRPATTTQAIPGRVRIWAVPATVPLGSRTSVFWTSQGVTSCLVTSPDGSFTQSSLSGGASTVPITTATTYSISCLQSDGIPVTGYTTVTISI